MDASSCNLPRDYENLTNMVKCEEKVEMDSNLAGEENHSQKQIV